MRVFIIVAIAVFMTLNLVTVTLASPVDDEQLADRSLPVKSLTARARTRPVPVPCVCVRSPCPCDSPRGWFFSR
ncbi:hypothetical protein V1264_024485 [Littorina saxatilis]|uniref:Uncharacterized protein n=1 Tax=Littorina saxatilis TaxID=31220 RepID=A0AAN9FZ05_9CAEN